MRPSLLNQAVRHFFKTTTLHGFKYLFSDHYVDRVGWVLCCFASACCAGVLCVVLWARFLEVPALLALLDDTRASEFAEERMPTVVVCPPVESIAHVFVDRLSPNKSLTKRLPITLHRLLTGRTTAVDQLSLLDQLLSTSNMTLPQVIMDYTPSCSKLTKKCRYQKTLVPCDGLFEKEMVSGGLCCVMRPQKLSKVSTRTAGFQTSQMLELVLQCSGQHKLHSCEFVTMYEGEEWAQPTSLTPGYYYMAQLRFSVIPENTDDKLVEQICVSDKQYSRKNCMLKCAEKSCGCSDPFLNEADAALLPCSVRRLGCLRAFGYRNNISCECLPSCKKITTYMVLESSPMNLMQHVIDPFFFGINATAATVVNLRVNIGHSRVLVLNPTETWLTLLSSLGGVFNMFLGVGLFSALEFLYVMLVKLPLAMKKTSRVHPAPTPVVLLK